MRVTLAQLPVQDWDIGANLINIKEAVMQAADENSDIVLTPEGSLSGYHHLFDFTQLREALAEIEAFAAFRRVGLALGACMEEADGLRYNELRFYSPCGEYLGCHTKALLCGSGEPPEGELNHYAVKPLRVFDFMGVTVGGLICNDLWASPGCTSMPDPHLTKQISRMGAKIIFHAVNGGRDESELSQGLVRKFHEVHVLMKAQADGLIICTADNAWPEHIVVSSLGGVALPNASWLCTLPDQGRQVATFDIGKL
ncbi:MAG: carbon-nitrogen hydrolase family protein [Oscillospiraceae bacterium]|nr:carbon-nitrogen hydrolase family protein [Oscillospiraceae bacterium]